MDEETFESRHSEADHLSQVRSVVRNHSAPEFDIDATLALCSLNFDPGDGMFGDLAVEMTQVLT